MINIDVSMAYALGPARTALLALEAARTSGQTVAGNSLRIEDATLRRFGGEGGVGERVWATCDGDTLRLRYSAQVTVSRPPVRLAGLAQTPPETLTEDLLPYVRPSRFCQSDLFERFTTQHFGPLSGGDRIAAILDWIGAEMEYAPGHSDATTTLLETFAARRGVCRDYVHVLCGLARASYIPARYVSAYGARVDPPDFHAVAEVWLDGGWHLVDPTGMCGADELAVIGVGRDAADVPFMETPDQARFLHQKVTVSHA